MLTWRKKELPAPETPSPTQLSARTRSLLHRLDWTVVRPLASRPGGTEQSRQRGPGIELAEIREYQPGDDVRQIDWNITARSGATHVRESYSERGLDAWLLLDLSASVDWGTAGSTKREQAVEFVGAAGLLLQRQGNRLGAILFSDKVLGVVPPGASRYHLQNILSQINNQPKQTGADENGITAALTLLQNLARRKSLVLVVSDFLTSANWQPLMGKLALRHEIVAVNLHDPREAELPDIGIVTLEDPETGRQMVINTHDRKLRERFRAAALAQAETLAKDLTTCGVGQLALGTHEQMLPALARFLNARKMHKRVRGRPGV
jgi:uncharacterized protein (DUF58 family)